MAEQPPDHAPAAHRLPDATHVGAARLQVSGLDRSLTYYTTVLGLESRSQSSNSATLAAPGQPQPLLVLEEQPDARPVPRGGLLGLYHFAILLPSRSHLGRFVQHLAAGSVRFSAADHFVSEALYIWDPDGLGIEVYADRPRDAWRMRGNELVMTTEPLDLRALADAGGPEPWLGMPRGTTMGHMHLSVSDLGAARALYHEALGLDVTVWSYPGALFLSAGGYHHHLGLNTWAAGARAAGPEDARLMEWTLVLPTPEDVGAAARRMQAAGHHATTENDDQIVTDPWHTRLRLTAAKN
jgi:catechol 2,3-dioxygenase